MTLDRKKPNQAKENMRNGRQLGSTKKEKVALAKAIENLKTLIDYQEYASELLEACGGVTAVVLGYDNVLEAKGYSREVRLVMVAEQAMWWGYKKGICKLGEINEAMEPVLNVIPGLAEVVGKIKGK